MNSYQSDDGLLELAEIVLEGAGYVVKRLEAEHFSMSLAENEFNAAIVAALVSTEDFVEVEPVVARQLTERLLANDAGLKRWDAYVVLLSAQRPSEDQTESLAALANNLRQVRRVIRVGLSPTHAAVARALRLLLPLPALSAERSIANPMELMRERLLSDGVDASAVQAAIEAFRVEQQAASNQLDSFDHESESGTIGDG